MSLKKVHGEQPKEFKFSSENLKKAEEILKKYPEKNKKSAVMPFLYLAQRQNNNWIPLAAMKYIANFLSMPYISVYEVATFYTMYNLAPVGKHFIQVCTTTPCLIRGADKIVKLCKEKISQKEIKSLLDYGGGGSNWDEPGFEPKTGESAKKFFNIQKVTTFEPARNLLNKEKSDCVVCIDVLEHIYIADIPNVVNELFSLSNNLLIINVACYKAAAILPNSL